MAADKLDALHLVLQRRQHGRELARLCIGGYIYIIGVVVVATGTVGRALDGLRGTLHGNGLCAERAVAVLIEDVVERALRVTSQAELDGGLA